MERLVERVVALVAMSLFFIVGFALNEFMVGNYPFYEGFFDSFSDRFFVISIIPYFLMVSVLYYLHRAYFSGEFFERYDNPKKTITVYSVCIIIGTVALWLISMFIFMPSGLFRDITMVRRGEHRVIETRLDLIQVQTNDRHSTMIHYLTVLEEVDRRVIVRQQITWAMYRDLRNETNELQRLQRRYGEFWERALEMRGQEIPRINFYYMPHTQNLFSFSITRE